MNRRYSALLTILGVLVTGAALLFLPVRNAHAAAPRLTGDINASPRYDDHAVSHYGRWFAFKGLQPGTANLYDLYIVDLSKTPYVPVRIDVPRVTLSGILKFSMGDRFLLIQSTNNILGFQGANNILGWQLYVYDLLKGNLYTVASGYEGVSAHISPDERILLLTDGLGSPVYSRPITGGTPIVLNPPDFPQDTYLTQYKFTPDGQHIIITALSYTTTKIGAVGYAPLTGTGTTLWSALGEFPTSASSVQFSLDGGTAYVPTHDFISGQERLYSIDIESGTVTTLLSGDSLDLRQGDERYAFLRYEVAGTTTVYRLSLNDGTLAPLFQTSENVYGSFATNDATNRIAIRTFHDSQTTIHVGEYDPPTTPRPVITVPMRHFWETQFDFSPDGQKVIVAEDLTETLDYRIHVADATGALPPTVLLGGASTTGHPLVSNTSDALWTTLKQSTQRLVVYLPLDGSYPMTVFSPPEGTSLMLQQFIGKDRALVLARGLTSGFNSYYLTDLRPTASVTASGTLLEEGMTTTLDITLVPSSSLPLTLTFELTGTADSSDIELVPPVVRVPPYSESATVTVRAVPDGAEEPTEQVSLILKGGDGVVIAMPDRVNLTLVDRLNRVFAPLIRYFD